MRVPARVDLPDNEVDPEPADHPSTSQLPPDRLRVGTDEPAIGGVGREGAADERLTAVAAEHLVMGGEDFHLSFRTRPQLHARATQIAAHQAFLDHTAA